MYTSNLLAYTKGLFKKNTIITYEIMKNDTHYSTFKQLISNNITTEHIDDLRTMLFLKINPQKININEVIHWFEKSNSITKQIIIIALCMNIKTEQELYKLERQPEHSDTETENVFECNSEFEYELVTCGNCGNQWDGMAQCNCWRYDSTENTEEHVEAPQEPVPTSHSQDWMSTSHYGMCGQSCPCCRAEVGDTLGACPICKKN